MPSGKSRKKRISVTWKMFAILICFVTLFASLIWLFEIRMLNFFYQGAKFSELEDSSKTVEYCLHNRESVSDTVGTLASELYNDIWIYRVVQGELEYITYANGTRESVAIFIEPQFDSFYEKACENEGVYIAMVPMKNFRESYFEFNIIRDNMGKPQSFPFVSGNVRKMTAIYSSVCNIGSTEYLIVQRSNIEPLGVMIQTLENQVLFVGTILIIFALVLALCMGKFITKPIVKMNEAAKGLAAGRYDTEFSTAHGYLEIEELADTLSYASRELSKSDALQKELIANLSHDLRTPLTMIKGYGEVMRDIPGENTSENIQVIIEETERLSALVNDMFDLSKLEAGTRNPQIERICITELVRNTLERYEKLVRQDGYKIDFEAEKDIYIYADRTMILQVLYNLINNAVNYTGEDKSIRVVQCEQNGRVKISVFDTGEGISEADIPFIWDRYYKVDRVHKRASVGSGLGLSIVKQILEMHHAAYGVTSTLKKGSEFWFELATVDNQEYDAQLVKL